MCLLRIESNLLDYSLYSNFCLELLSLGGRCCSNSFISNDQPASSTAWSEQKCSGNERNNRASEA